MGSSNGKRKEIKFSKKEKLFLKTFLIWPKSKHLYPKRKFSESLSKDKAVFYATEKEMKIKDAIYSSKMTLNPNVRQISTNASKNLKYDITLLTQVLDLLLMMIGCILLKIDHKSRVKKEFTDVFNDVSLEILRSDLENLLRFESKSSLTRIILDLMNSQAAGELIWSENLKDPLASKKLILRRTLISVVNFLIFRRSKQRIEFKNKIRRSVFSLKAANKLENGENLSVNGSKTKLKFSFLGVWMGMYKKVSGEEGGNLKETNFDMDLFQGQLNVYGEDFYDCALSTGSHSCNKIYCPVCYGWLWIPFYYCICIFIYPLVMSLMCSFTNGIRFLP